MQNQMSISTELAFRLASDWTASQLRRVRDGGVWVIPRTDTVIHVVSHKALQAQVLNGNREPLVIMFMQTRGWQCTKVAKI